MNIVFPELNNPNIKSALEIYNSTPDVTPVTPISANSLDSACGLLISRQADAMIAGIDYSSRDVILACRDHLGMANYNSPLPSQESNYTTFSGLAVMERPKKSQTIIEYQKDNQTTLESQEPHNSEIYLLADMAACKHPSKNQLIEIILQTATSAQKILQTTPRLALLSFSTLGSGGHDAIITTFNEIVTEFHAVEHLPFYIDGELQLDAAINPVIAQKKAPNSPVAGQANVLIAPDLNSGNLLYKAFEQIGGFVVAGPILQGFNFPVSDLSRGSTVDDIILTIKTLTSLIS